MSAKQPLTGKTCCVSTKARGRNFSDAKFYILEIWSGQKKLKEILKAITLASLCTICKQEAQVEADTK